VLVYSITDGASFEKLSKFRENIMLIAGTTNVPIMMVGNKSHKESARVVSKKDGKKQAEKWGTIFTEASAKTPKKVEEVFIRLVKLIDKWREAHPFSLSRSHSICTSAPQSCVLI